MIRAALKYLPKWGGTGVTKALLGQSIPGAILSGGGTALYTGDPMAGVAVGMADLLGSTAVGRGLASRRLKNVVDTRINPALGKVTIPFSGGKHPSVKLAGSWQQAIDPKTKQPLAPNYLPSTVQTAGIWGTSLMAPYALEPMFVGNQRATQTQQLAQRSILNGPQHGRMSDGTMFQLAGVPMRADDIRGMY